MNERSHKVLKLWIRPQEGGEMVEVDSIDLEEGKGVVGDHSWGSMRHVTIIFEDDWAAASRELEAEVDPSFRRANVLVSGGDGQSRLKTKMILGEAQLEIKGIVAPCDLMDQQHAGLKDALKPDGRAGIWGRILLGGPVRLHDELKALEGAAAE